MHIEHMCPPCGDGGYGQAYPGRTYRCPRCRCTWSPTPQAGSAATRLGQAVQRITVRMTS